MTVRRLSGMVLLGLVAAGPVARPVTPASLRLRASDHVDATFDGEGAHLGSIVIGLRSIGRGQARLAVSEGRPRRLGPEIQIARGLGLTEWWRSVAHGLEQGVTIASRPNGDGVLALEMGVGASIRTESVTGGEVALYDDSGRLLARYGHLVVLDAEGSQIPSRLIAIDDGMELRIDDGSARYPIVVDPLVVAEEAALGPSTVVTGFGDVTSLSGDGSRGLVIGGSTPFVFARSGTGWAEEARLSGGGPSAAMSDDGLRVLVGVPSNEAGPIDGGAALVFVRSGTTWAQEAQLLLPDGITGDAFGESVALDASGTRAILGTYHDNVSGAALAGSARVFVRSGSSWGQEALLSRATPQANDEFGASVAISADGTRAVVGAIHADTVRGVDAGSVEIFLRSGSSWNREAAVAVGAATSYCGLSVSMSGDGSRAAFVCNRESLHLYSRSGTTWAEEGAFPMLASATAELTLAMSDDGSRVLVGDNATSVGRQARLFVRGTSGWAEETGLPVPTPGGGPLRVAISGDGTRGLIGSPNDDVGGTDRGTAHVFTLRLPNGLTCSTLGECSSGLCVDGVCCATACAGGTADCQACSVASGGTSNGTCTPLSAAGAPSVVCRPAAPSGCDAPEVCVAGNRVCPTDAFLGPPTLCRPAALPCDAPELCDGAGPACPPDRALAAGATCRPATGLCDVRDVCDGTRLDCPADDVMAAGFSCRPAAGLCDLPEVCDGTSPTCPGDRLAMASTICGGAGTCREAAACDGASVSCPASGRLRDAGFECAPQLRDAGGNPLPCDLPDLCDGVSELCMPRFAPASAACGDATLAGPCDAPDHCAGTSADCEATYLSGVACRPSVGACDPGELCLGDAAECPADQVSPAHTVCRAAATPGCDPAESCDGTAASCPPDVSSCLDAAMTDAAVADASFVDAASPDAGTAMPASGCACRVGASRPTFSLVVGAVALFVGWRRRRSRRARCSMP